VALGERGGGGVLTYTTRECLQHSRQDSSLTHRKIIASFAWLQRLIHATHCNELFWYDVVTAKIDIPYFIPSLQFSKRDETTVCPHL
jgi:hypothetical protein